MFAGQHCNATPEPIPGSNLVVVRHSAGCAVRVAQTKARWPLTTAALPDVPAQVPFEHLAAFGRWHKTVLSREQRRQARR
jgi:plasmid replication initiation protein